MKLLEFLADKTFRIPSYQRDYSWGRAQVDDLLNDIDEAVQGTLSHYLGTFVLSRTEDDGPFEVVDGQQRLTTLVLVVIALLKQLPRPDQDKFAAILIRDMFTGRLKLHFGVNDDFATKLLTDDDFLPSLRNGGEPAAGDSLELTGGRRRLCKAFGIARERTQYLHEAGGGDKIREWIKAITRMEVIQFSAGDTGRAIRMFQTINDRGLALSAMDKAKALLIYYSNRYLGGDLDETINRRFGRCFVAFDCVKELVRNEEYRVGHIHAANFWENQILRYHYLAYDYPGIEGGGNFRVNDRTVLDGLLRQTMHKHRKNDDKLRLFIDDYTDDLCKFFQAFQKLVERIRTSRRLYKLFVVLGFSARLYPLLIRLHQRGILEKAVFDGGPDLLKCLEICDMRVYKMRRSAAAADIGRLSYRSRTLESPGVSNWLRWITIKSTPGHVLRGILTAPVFSGAGLSHLLVEYDEDCRGEPYSLDELKELVRETTTREHVLPSDPGLFDLTSLGFVDIHEYREHVDQLGNVLPLTSKMNSRCGNRSPFDKMTAPNLYKDSRYCSTRKFAATYGGTFHKDHLVERTERLASWAMERWRLWDQAPSSPAD